MRRVDLADINSFLRVGYFLKYRNPSYSLDLSCGDKRRYSGADTEELVQIGIEKFKNAIARRFCPNQEHVVPLSGGLDSRAILSALLEHTEARNIRTYTFGTPATYDYDIGNEVARAAGTVHLRVPLTQYEYTVDKLVKISPRVDHQTCLFHHPDVDLVDNYCEGRVVWSGTIIDVFFGRHDHEKEASDWDTAKRNFIRENLYNRSINIADAPDESLFGAIAIDEALSGKMALEHALDLLNRQLKFIAPHVLMKGYDYKVLFDDTDLVAYCLSIDGGFLRSQTLYKQMLLKAFPGLFRLRTKTAEGFPLGASELQKKLWRCMRNLKNRVHRYCSGSPTPHPYCNYIDFARGIRERRDVRHVVSTCCKDLKRRGVVPWIDVEKIWEQHESGVYDFSGALLSLASLELHFKAGLQYVGGKE